MQKQNLLFKKRERYIGGGKVKAKSYANVKEMIEEGFIVELQKSNQIGFVKSQ